MGLAGVAEVEVDEADDSPSGVRVRLQPDADARLVGVEVQRILASHGLRSRITAQEDQAPEDQAPGGQVPDVAPISPPDAGTSPEVEAVAESAPVPEAAPVPEPAFPTPPPPIPEAVPLAPPVIPPPPSTPPPVVPVPEPVATGPAPDAAASGSGLASVSVEESRDAVTVTATSTDGRASTQSGEATEAGMYAAVVAAVGILAEGTPPGLISITPLDAAGAQAIAVVVERSDGSKAAGAAVVGVGAGFAVGRATWSALRGA